MCRWWKALLDQAFVEFGKPAVGTCAVGDRDLRAPGIAAEYQVDGVERMRLAPGLAQLRDRSIARRQEIERQALRSPQWRNNAAGWRLLFHQGTLFTENAAS